MASKSNPYKKGEEREKVRPGGNNPTGEPPVVPEPPTPPQEPVTESPDPMVGKDFLAKFVEPKSPGKAHSLYLSDEAGKKLEKLAKQLKCSKSKALDILLRNAVE